VELESVTKFKFEDSDLERERERERDEKDCVNIVVINDRFVVTCVEVQCGRGVRWNLLVPVRRGKETKR
jgi:hypothetical protein